MENIGKIFVFVGLIIVILGFIFLYVDRLPIKIGALPGDILIRNDYFTLYIPLTTSLLISIVLSVILIVISKLFK
ncbi:MAG: hypothetical protein KatS3mg084_0194 [Candidatus Dojkabacteria bacterium]|jgi:hypothetical protein|nr:MAG: hypothetical protein KatS3mg084_0194 [Candidatus Dojkabacteria bacterium]